ncbi:MAG: DegT/DnrJ/EryC1/StrS family aminotransferase [Chloroflexi bacterium]|nr:DegT/DnrJ/EryC1/StrS family aminotransferase [Chloroflexota bacterium]
MTTQRRRIPVNEPVIGEAERRNVLRCLEQGWISSEGAFVDEFERTWAAYCGMTEGVAVSSGTTALELALATADLEPGDEVILPSFTIISCVLAVLEAGAVPVLVDCDPDTWCMDVDQVASRIGPRTRAVMPVHIYGHPVDMDPLLALADRHRLRVIEDAAEAHGAQYRGRRVGGLGSMSCFSFYANKIVTTGEGGMVLTSSPETAARLRSGRNLAFGTERRFLHTALGHNYRLTNLQAAIGVAQIASIDERVRRKREIATRYTDRLTRLPQLQLPVERPWATNVYWMYGVVLREDAGIERDELAARLRDRGVDTRPFFVGMHEQPVLQRMGLFAGERYPNSERIASRGLYLPSGLALTREQQHVVCATLEDALR